MSKDLKKWMPLFWADYFRGTQTFVNCAEHGAYLLLIAYCWHYGALPSDDEDRRRIAKCGVLQWRGTKYRRGIRDIVCAKFDDLGRNERCDIELAHAIEKSRRMSANAKLRHSFSSAEADTPTPTPKGLDSKRLNGRQGGEGRRPPRHGAFKADHSRVFFYRTSSEWEAYAADYREHHGGADPPLQWNGLGSWFNWTGESK